MKRVALVLLFLAVTATVLAAMTQPTSDRTIPSYTPEAPAPSDTIEWKD